MDVFLQGLKWSGFFQIEVQCNFCVRYFLDKIKCPKLAISILLFLNELHIEFKMSKVIANFMWENNLNTLVRHVCLRATFVLTCLGPLLVPARCQCWRWGGSVLCCSDQEFVSISFHFSTCGQVLWRHKNSLKECIFSRLKCVYK